MQTKINVGQRQELVLESQPTVIHQVETLIEDYRNELQFKDDVFGNVMIAVTEAVNNAIQHGNKNDIQKKVHLYFELLQPYQLNVGVKDEGDGFDYEHLADPTSPENIDKPGGRGIFLMQHLTEKIQFNHQGREVVMTFYI